MSGNSNTLQGVRKYGKSDHLQLLIEMYGGDITMGLEGSYPTRRPHVRRDNFVSSALELGIPLGGGREGAWSKNHSHVSILEEAKAEYAKLQ